MTYPNEPYKCAKCGQIHSGWPAIAFNAPHYYYELTEIEKSSIATLSNNFCTIRHPDQTDRFIRVVLKQRVIDHCETLDYGVWVSLSEKSYDDYDTNFESENYAEGYFGYLSNQIPGYESTLVLKMNVWTSKGGNRPEAIPQDNQMEVAFVRDYLNGITIEEAQKRVDAVLKR